MVDMNRKFNAFREGDLRNPETGEWSMGFAVLGIWDIDSGCTVTYDPLTHVPDSGNPHYVAQQIRDWIHFHCQVSGIDEDGEAALIDIIACKSDNEYQPLYRGTIKGKSWHSHEGRCVLDQETYVDSAMAQLDTNPHDAYLDRHTIDADDMYLMGCGAAA